MFFIHVWSDVTCVSAYGQLQTEGRLHLSLNFWTVTKGLRRKGAPWTWTPLWECNRQGVTPGCEPALSAPGGCAGGRRPSTLLLPVRLPCRRLAQGPPSALPPIKKSFPLEQGQTLFSASVNAVFFNPSWFWGGTKEQKKYIVFRS